MSLIEGTAHNLGSVSRHDQIVIGWVTPFVCSWRWVRWSLWWSYTHARKTSVWSTYDRLYYNSYEQDAISFGVSLISNSFSSCFRSLNILIAVAWPFSCSTCISHFLVLYLSSSVLCLWFTAMLHLQESRVISRLLVLVLLLQNRSQALAIYTMQVRCNIISIGLQWNGY